MKHLAIVIPTKATFFLIIKALTTTNLYNNSVSPKFFRVFYSVSPKFFRAFYSVSPKCKHKLVIMIYATQNILYFKILISDRSHTHSRLMTDLGLNIWHGFCTCCYKLLYFCTLLLQMCDIITNFTHRKKVSTHLYKTRLLW